MFSGNANQNTDTTGDPAEVDKVITGIMKQDECMKAPESIKRADGREPYGLALSTELGIKPGHTDTESVLSQQHSGSLPASLGFENQVCALTANTHGSITWAKTIQIICESNPHETFVDKEFRYVRKYVHRLM